VIDVSSAELDLVGRPVDIVSAVAVADHSSFLASAWYISRARGGRLPLLCLGEFQYDEKMLRCEEDGEWREEDSDSESSSREHSSSSTVPVEKLDTVIASGTSDDSSSEIEEVAKRVPQYDIVRVLGVC